MEGPLTLEIDPLEFSRTWARELLGPALRFACSACVVLFLFCFDFSFLLGWLFDFILDVAKEMYVTGWADQVIFLF